MLPRYLQNMNKLVISKYVSVTSKSVEVNSQPILENEGDESFNDFIKRIYQHYHLQYPKFFKMDNLSKLGFVTAEILRTGEDSKAMEPQQKAIVLANSASSLFTDENYHQTIKEIPSPAVFVYTLPNIVAGEICIRHDIKGESIFFIQQAFDIPFIRHYVDSVFATTGIKSAFIGWVEFDLNQQYHAFLMEVSYSDSQNNYIGIFNEATINQIYKINQ